MKKTRTDKKSGASSLVLAFLAITAVTAVIIGAWLLYMPEMEKDKALRRQEALLTSIAEGTGVITLADSDQLTVDSFGYDIAAGGEEDEYDLYIAPINQEVFSEPVNFQLSTQNFPLEIEGIGILTIGKIDLKLPVVDGVSKAQLKIAVGRVPQTAWIGEAGNAVIAGHRSYTYGKYFNRLGEIEVGDVIGYTSKSGEAMLFEVYDILVVEPGDQSVFAQPMDYSEITLLTCTPVRKATHRLLVKAKLIEGR